MTVAELIELLKRQDPELIVVISSPEQDEYDDVKTDPNTLLLHPEKAGPRDSWRGKYRDANPKRDDPARVVRALWLQQGDD